LRIFYRKIKKKLFCSRFFFIWIIIKNDWSEIKSIKKLKFFYLIFFFIEVKRNRRRVKIICQTSSTPPIKRSTRLYARSLITFSLSIGGSLVPQDLQFLVTFFFLVLASKPAISSTVKKLCFNKSHLSMWFSRSYLTYSYNMWFSYTF
jgi:hypothetical protein